MAKPQRRGPRWQWGFLAHALALMLACAVPLTGLAVFSILRLGEAQAEVNEGAMMGTARAVSMSIDQQLRDSKRILEVLASSFPSDIGSLFDYYEHCRMVAAQYQGTILLADTAGNQLFNTAHALGSDLPAIGRREDFREAVQSDEMRISDLLSGVGDDDQPQLSLYLPLRKDGEVRYVLVMDFPAELISDLLAQQGFPDAWVVAAVDRRGTIFARQKQPGEVVGRAASPEVRDFSGTETFLRITNIEHHQVYMAVVRSSLAGWRTVVSVPRALFDAPLWISLRQFGEIGIAVLLAALGTAFLIARYLSIKMTALADATRALGRHQPMPEVTSTVRELNRIAATLGDAGRELTELGAAEQRQRELERQLLHAQKLEALGTLAGGIAHDLNNTLVPVIGLAKLTMRRLAPESRERTNLATIQRAGERARDLVRQILAFSRKEAPTRARVDFARLLHESLAMVRASLPATIGISEAIAEVPPVLGDPGQLHQVVINLVVNAAQAIDAAMGTISITLNADHRAFADETLAPCVHFSVEDTGCGMDEATQERIFEPFFTTKAVGEGTGLGLSVVHGIVVQHGGRISVESRKGHGTRFDIYLPTLADESVLGPMAAAAQ